MVYNTDNQIGEFQFDGRINYKLSNQWDQLMSKSFNNVNQVYLNFEFTQFISLPGAIYLFYIISYISQQNKKIEIRILNLNEIIAFFLLKIDFFNHAKTYGNLRFDNALEEFSSKYSAIKKKNNTKNQKSIYLPFKTLPFKSSKYFETNSEYLNSFMDCFNLIVLNGRLNIKDKGKEIEFAQRFRKAVYELSKNIWEHSNSWGLSAMFSTNSTGSTIAICDLGIGFISSYMSRNSDYKRSTANDIELIDLLLKKGKSSKRKNGYGLSKVIDFTKKVGGTLLIRTDEFEVTLKPSQLVPLIKRRNYCLGTQVFINF